MKKNLLAVAVAMLSVASAQAALVGRDINGNAVTGNAASSVFLYDDVLNVTWLRDANANGAMTWDQANTWVANLTVGSYSGWRLPTMIDTGTPGCVWPFGGIDCGPNVQTKSGNKTQYEAGQTVYSEMASLFSDTLGNIPFSILNGGTAEGAGLTNTGDFLNLNHADVGSVYWSGLESALDPNDAWFFDFGAGWQNFGEKSPMELVDESDPFGPTKPVGYFALAVRPGDVLAPAAAVVPVPAALPLLLSGLAALGVAGRRRGRRRLGDSGASAS